MEPNPFANRMRAKKDREEAKSLEPANKGKLTSWKEKERKSWLIFIGLVIGLAYLYFETCLVVRFCLEFCKLTVSAK